MTSWQRQHRIQRFTLLGGIIILVAVVALIATGLYLDKLKPNQQIVFKVGDTSYNMRYYLDAVDYYGPMNYSYLQGMGVEYSQFLNYYLPSFANTIQENQIIKEAAAKLEPPIVVSEDEINKFIKENKISKNKATYDAVYSALLDKKLTDKFDQALPEITEHRAVLAMFLESQSQIDDVLARIGKGETFHDLAESMSLDSTTKNKSGDLGWVARGVIPTILNTADDKSLDDLAFSPDTKVNVYTRMENKTKGKSMGYWVIQVVDIKEVAAATPTPAPTPTPAANNTQVKINVMLLGSQELALEMKKQLENGADFASLAKTHSQYENAAENGGILDYIAAGTLSDAVDAVLFPEDAAKRLQNGQITDPIQDTSYSTKGGFWLAQVTGIENKTLDGDNRTTLTSIDKQAWRNQIWLDNSDKIVDLFDQVKIEYATVQAIKRFNANR